MKITEIRKMKYLENLDRESFNKIISHFNNKTITADFLLDIIACLLKKYGSKNVMVLMDIGRLFFILDRLAEAEEYFSFAYMQSDTKIEIIENLNRIYAKRTKIYHCNWTISRLYELHAPEKIQLIARIRNSFIWGYFENAYNDALSNFELLKNNEEFLILSVQAATFLGKGKLLLAIFNDSSCKEIICSFSESYQTKIKHALTKYLIQLIKNRGKSA
jgi:hypothetical protein